MDKRAREAGQVTASAARDSMLSAFAAPPQQLPLDKAPTMTSEISSRHFREALGHFATGVTVITALDESERICGLTANAFSALSLSPPLVLACVNHSARTLPAIKRASQLAIHILSAEHDHIADGFSRRGTARDSVCSWSLSSRGIPVLNKYAIALECELTSVYPGGDHAILVCEVLAIHHAERLQDPLLYYRGELTSLKRLISKP